MRPDDVATMMRRFIERLRAEGLAPLRGLEVTIECMPQTIGTPLLSGLRPGGFTRYSLSMQSIIDAELEALDCGFTARDVQNAVLFLDRFHVHNVNLDLMYGNPLQTLTSWKQTLRAVRDFDPEHISLYPFPGKAADCPDASEVAAIIDFAQGFLGELGYARYTRYHFAKPNKQCRYFLERYGGADYLGFGLGARSLIDDISYANTHDWGTYLAHSADFERIVTDVVQLTAEQQDEYREASRALLV
jgi:oxygen-independent coproporphyrinogen-3 oxidase